MKPGAGLKRHFIPTMAGLEVQDSSNEDVDVSNLSQMISLEHENDSCKNAGPRRVVCGGTGGRRCCHNRCGSALARG